MMYLPRTNERHTVYITIGKPRARVTKPHTYTGKTGTVYTLYRNGRQWEAHCPPGLLVCPTLRELKCAVADYDDARAEREAV